MRDCRGEGGREDRKCRIGNVRAQKWNEGDNRESRNQRSVRQAGGRNRELTEILYATVSSFPHKNYMDIQ